MLDSSRIPWFEILIAIALVLTLIDIMGMLLIPLLELTS